MTKRIERAEEMMRYRNTIDVLSLWNKTDLSIEDIAKKLKLDIKEVETIIITHHIDKIMIKEKSKEQKDQLVFVQTEELEEGVSYIRLDTIEWVHSDDDEDNACVITQSSTEEEITETCEDFLKRIGAKIIYMKT